MSKLDQRLEALAALSPAQLREEWQRVMKAPPPRLGADLLRLIIGYKLQEKALGGLSPVHARQLRQGSRAGAPSLKPGTRLLRRWNGRTVSVTVGEEGFLFEGRSYGSLSHIARDVTGAAWSGPRFFGLTGSAAAGASTNG